MRNNKLLIFCLKVVAFWGVIFLIDRGVECVFMAMKNSGLETNPENMWVKTPFVVERVDAEMLVIGSSKASHHYVPTILSDSLKVTVYNCGQDGCFFLYQNCIINMVLDRYQPKMIIWDIQPELFNHVGGNSGEYQNIRYLSPYYDNSSWVASYVNSETRLMKLKMQSKMFAYNSKIFNYLLPLVEKGEQTTNGYIPLANEGYSYPKIDEEFKEEVPYHLDNDKLALLSRTIERCKVENVSLFFSISPTYNNKANAYLLAVKDIQKVTSDCGIACYDYSSDSIFMNDPTLFKDASHLNDKGAKLFTEMVASKIMDKAYHPSIQK